MSQVYQGSAYTSRKTRRGWVRLRTCPICGHRGWCSMAPDRDAIKCMRIASDHPCADGGWIHPLDGAAVRQEDVRPFTTGVDIADPDTLHAVLSDLLSMMYLDEEHREKERLRGIPDSAADYFQHKTLTAGGCSRLMRELLKKHSPEALRRTPGPKFVDTVDGGFWSLAGPPGIVMPCRDVQERIQCLQLRPDDIEKFPKVMWCSSVKNGGPQAGTPVHVPLCQVESPDVYLVEGIWTADAVACMAGVRVVGLSGGCASWRFAIDTLKEMKPDRVVLCFDNDRIRNMAVGNAQKGASRALRAEGFRIAVGRWPMQHKGPDDALVAGCKIEVVE